MTKIGSYASLALFVVTSCAVAGPTAAPAAVRITNSHLVATCLDGKPISGGTRSWNLTAPASLTLTMRNEPRVGRPGADAGFASIGFTPEDGHTYEIEVRSDPMLYSSRVWPKGEWRPVVRDRTTEKIVSSEPQWVAGPECGNRR